LTSVVKDTFLLCSNTKYKILLKNVFEILLSNTLKVGLKIQNTKYFFPNVSQIQNTSGQATAVFSTVENIITVYVRDVIQHTTQSLHSTLR